MLAGRVWIPRLALAIVTLGLTLALGRVWCGWLCPLGRCWSGFASPLLDVPYRVHTVPVSCREGTAGQQLFPRVGGWSRTSFYFSSLLRPVIVAACNRCAKCVGIGRLEAVDADTGFEIIPSDCTVCLDCLAACPEGDVDFRWHWRSASMREYDPTRRQVLVALATGVVVLRTGIHIF